MTPYVAPTAMSALFRPLCGVERIVTLCPAALVIMIFLLVHVVDMTIARPLVRRLVSIGAVCIEATPSAAASLPAAAIEARMLAPCAPTCTQQMLTGLWCLAAWKRGTLSGE